MTDEHQLLTQYEDDDRFIQTRYKPQFREYVQKFSPVFELKDSALTPAPPPIKRDRRRRTAK
ncbi:hypothetical protein [Chromatium okenii]|uniref:hypothetical protein n=1 Tax=Chromatium okenii TaxID=61644 RepID=UPI0026E95A66|nr:hypothetical protein [Chromatium okenii]MBV5311556.1 hypothetical protein [Chromatium okenii]